MQSSPTLHALRPSFHYLPASSTSGRDLNRTTPCFLSPHHLSPQHLRRHTTGIKRKKTRMNTNTVRRFLRDVLGDAPALSTRGKCERTEDLADREGPAVGRANTSFSVSTAAVFTTCIITLQNESLVEDTIVVTAPNIAPFCCHAYLVTVSRTQLLTVSAIRTRNSRAYCRSTSGRGARTSPSGTPWSSSSVSATIPCTRPSLLCQIHYGVRDLRPFDEHSPGPLRPTDSPRPMSPRVRSSHHSISLGPPALNVLHGDAREQEEGSPFVSEVKRQPPQKKAAHQRADHAGPLAPHRVFSRERAHSDDLNSSEQDTDSPSSCSSPRVRTARRYPAHPDARDRVRPRKQRLARRR